MRRITSFISTEILSWGRTTRSTSNHVNVNHDAVESRRTMQTFIPHIAWESEVWMADDPDHMIHFNGERFLGPYPDVMPAKP